jgi:hypothetical protein
MEALGSSGIARGGQAASRTPGDVMADATGPPTAAIANDAKPHAACTKAKHKTDFLPMLHLTLVAWLSPINYR